MLNKITLVTLLITSSLVSAEAVQNNAPVINKIAPVKIQAISLEKISSFKCSPFPFCVDYPEDDGSGGSVKTRFNDTTLVSKPE